MYICGRLWSRNDQYIMKQLINVKNISSCGDNNSYTVYISRFYENLNYRRKYDPLFHFYYIFYISSNWVLILYKSIENWCYKQIKLTYGSVFGPPIFFQHKCGKSYKSTIIFYEHSRTIQVYSEITWSFYLKNKQTFTSLSCVLNIKPFFNMYIFFV